MTRFEEISTVAFRDTKNYCLTPSQCGDRVQNVPSTDLQKIWFLLGVRMCSSGPAELQFPNQETRCLPGRPERDISTTRPCREVWLVVLESLARALHVCRQEKHIFKQKPALKAQMARGTLKSEKLGESDNC